MKTSPISLVAVVEAQSGYKVTVSIIFFGFDVIQSKITIQPSTYSCQKIKHSGDNIKSLGMRLVTIFLALILLADVHKINKPQLNTCSTIACTLYLILHQKLNSFAYPKIKILQKEILQVFASTLGLGSYLG